MSLFICSARWLLTCNVVVLIPKPTTESRRRGVCCFDDFEKAVMR